MSEHLTSADLERYGRGDGSAAELLAMDDHLSGCEECRGRMALPRGLAEWAARLDDEDATHLTHEQVVARVEHRVADADRFAIESHLQGCGSCREEVADLARFRDSIRKSPARWRWMIPAAAAAAVMVGFWIFNKPETPAGETARLELPASWSADDRAAVETALRQGALPVAATPAELVSKQGTLLGPSKTAAFGPVSPVGTIVSSDRPRFRWTDLAGAKSYRVEVYSGDFQLAAQSGPLQATVWIPEAPLARGVLYRWQVVATKGGQRISAPAPPAAEARFRVLDRAAFDRIEQAKSEPQGHLLAAVLLARSGLGEEARAELNALDPEARNLPEVQRLLANQPR